MFLLITSTNKSFLFFTTYTNDTLGLPLGFFLFPQFESTRSFLLLH